MRHGAVHGAVPNLQHRRSSVGAFVHRAPITGRAADTRGGAATFPFLPVESVMSNKSWFVTAKNGTTGDIAILDEIGAFGIDAAAFASALKALGPVRKIALSINSPGGDVFAGFAIYSMLQRHPAHITATVDGLAASMASVIAMAADKIIMPENSMMMIHNPTGVAFGGAEQIASFSDALDRLRQNIASAYSKRSGQPIAEVQAMMDRETWLAADEAVNLGFADEIEDPVRIAATFDTRRFRHPPKATRRSGEDLTARAWRRFRAAGR
jgi:ATP-dependent Clp endopeptidase proteolytic subunit ClpP